MANTGDVFVADGYCNSRVLHYTPSGEFVRQITLPKVPKRISHMEIQALFRILCPTHSRSRCPTIVLQVMERL